MMGLGGFPARHRLWLGMVGMHGTLAANRAARECDLLLVCGARFSDRVAGSRTGFAPHAEVVHIDVDHAEFDKNIPAAVRVAGDLKEVLARLADGLPPRRHEAWNQGLEACRRPVVPDLVGSGTPSPILWRFFRRSAASPPMIQWWPPTWASIKCGRLSTSRCAPPAPS